MDELVAGADAIGREAASNIFRLLLGTPPALATFTTLQALGPFRFILAPFPTFFEILDRCCPPLHHCFADCRLEMQKLHSKSARLCCPQAAHWLVSVVTLISAHACHAIQGTFARQCTSFLTTCSSISISDSAHWTRSQSCSVCAVYSLPSHPRQKTRRRCPQCGASGQFCSPTSISSWTVSADSKSGMS